MQGIWGQVLGEVLAAVHLPTVESATPRLAGFNLSACSLWGNTDAPCPPSPSRASSNDCRLGLHAECGLAGLGPDLFSPDVLPRELRPLRSTLGRAKWSKEKTPCQ